MGRSIRRQRKGKGFSFHTSREHSMPRGTYRWVRTTQYVHSMDHSVRTQYVPRGTYHALRTQYVPFVRMGYVQYGP